MKKLIYGLAVLFGVSAQAQMPLFRNQWTTNVPGAYVRGFVDIGTASDIMRVNGFMTNGTGIVVLDNYVRLQGGQFSDYFGFADFDKYVPYNAGVGYLMSAGSMVLTIDSNNDQTDRVLFFKSNNNAGGGSELMRLQENGRLGIATNDPQYTLDVHGTVRGTNIVADPPLWDDVRISLATLSNPSAQPGKITFAGGLTVYGFDDASTEQLDFTLQLPHGVNTNNAYGLRLHLHWTVNAAPTPPNTNVVWGLEWSIANPLTAYSAVTITNRVTNGIDTVRYHQIASLVRITNWTESAVLIGRLFREGGNTSDNLAGDAIGLSLDGHYPRRQFGSVLEFGDY
jgi:hypothetical protein